MKTKKDEVASAVIRAVVYSDIFDYPLTLPEIVKFLIGESRVGLGDVQKTLQKLVVNSELIRTDGEFYFLRGRQSLVETRKKRRGWSKKKLVIAKKAADELQMLSWIKTIAITGALAMENCEDDDDIDLMVITAANRLWLTRLILYALIPLWGIKRRRPKEREIRDKVCFNLFLEESNLQIQPENLFFAHEICQVRPIFDHDNVYKKFLWENRWVGEYLPNAVILSNAATQQHNNRSLIVSLLDCFLVFLENLAFKLQYLYMKPKITNEKVDRHQAFFHPKNLQEKIGTSFEERLREIKKA